MAVYCRGGSAFFIILYFSKAHTEKADCPLRHGFSLGRRPGKCGGSVFFGAVTDFFDFRVWPVFNVADIGIIIGVGLLVLYCWTHDSE